MPDELQYHGSSAELHQLLSSLTASLGGRSGDFAPYVRGIKLRIGMVALACVQEAFLEKSAGRTGDDGIHWKPLSKQTIASRRMGPGDKSLMKGYGAHNGTDALGRIKRGFLTPAQDKRWRQIYGTRKAWMMTKFGLSEAAANERAAQIAWSTLKAEGAKTKLEVLGNRNVMIGRDSGRLFNSLSPGVTEPDSHPLMQEAPSVQDRILREEAGAVVVGSNVEYALDFHLERPLWPAGELPASWNERLIDALRSGIAEAIEMITSGKAPGKVAA